MFKSLFTLLLTLYAACAMAAVDANKATQTELTQVKGIGAAMATRIVEARQQAPFKSWDDFIGRIKGVAHTSAAKLSEAGLTVNGQPFSLTEKRPTTAEKTPENLPKPTQSTGKKAEKS